MFLRKEFHLSSLRLRALVIKNKLRRSTTAHLHTANFEL